MSNDNNFTITPVAQSIPFDKDNAPECNFVSEDVQSVIEELCARDASFEGKGFQTAFIGNGTVRDEWLHSEDQNIEGQRCPDVLKFDARCVGIDFTNSNSGTDPIVIICISNAGNGSTLDRFYKWTLSNVRVALETDTLMGFTINRGDKLAVYVRDGGGDPFDVVVTMDFIVLNTINGKLTEDYTGNFNSAMIPATGSITEIFT